jgi:hypothetical protein
MTSTQPKYFIALKEGERARIFNEAAQAISELRQIYRKHGTGKLVFAARGLWFTVTGPWLNLHLAQNILFSKNGWPSDPPSWLVQALLARACELEIQSVDTSELPSRQIATVRP